MDIIAHINCTVLNIIEYFDSIHKPYLKGLVKHIPTVSSGNIPYLTLQYNCNINISGLLSILLEQKRIDVYLVSSKKTLLTLPYRLYFTHFQGTSNVYSAPVEMCIVYVES